ncbi:MAG: heavy-metal-associated domain-containing protein [Candidatus Microbacterium stercoravium]
MSDGSGCACGCGTTENTGLNITRRPADAPAPPSEVVLRIDGMTCAHCVASVTEELQEVPGVDAVDVDLVAGGTSTATVRTTVPVEPSALEAAIAEAGYTLA